jgi:hypothetical protein
MVVLSSWILKMWYYLVIWSFNKDFSFSFILPSFLGINPQKITLGVNRWLDNSVQIKVEKSYNNNTYHSRYFNRSFLLSDFNIWNSLVVKNSTLVFLILLLFVALHVPLLTLCFDSVNDWFLFIIIEFFGYQH